MTRSPRGEPPGGVPSIRKWVAFLSHPIEVFLHVEASSGILLLAAAVIALVWANSPWQEHYARLWHLPIGIPAGSFRFEQSLHFWVNEGLMTIFFLVVGLEIRREIHGGELSEPRRAALPVVAALGGMALPAALYLVPNLGLPSAAGWGVPMATDIAFAVGVLTMLGSRVPAALRVLLLALAIIDDVGAILVIAFFYSAGISPEGLLVATAGMGLAVLLRRAGVRRAVFYVPAGAMVWSGFYAAGVHPTLAGVVLGLMTPAVPPDRETMSPLARLEARLHPWVAYGIMPVFALANAGVGIDSSALSDASARPIFLGVVTGLVLGKPVGVVVASFLAVRIGIASLPRGIGWRGVWLVGLVAGIGFTMALFIAALAFPARAMLDIAKLAVLVGSVVSAALAFVASRWLLANAPGVGAKTPFDAERSTEE